MARSNKLFGHPKGLYYLFFTEMWERFSFYGMRALLILYMTEHLLYEDTMSFGIYAAYGSLVYATPLIGGYLSDNMLGLKKSIFLGGILMAIGHFVLAIDHEIAFYISLALLIVGNGFFKPNISTFVGELYKNDESKREAGFTIFYMGINIGGWLAPMICGYLGFQYGWHYGFGLAGIGMILGLLFFKSGISKGVFQNLGGVIDKVRYEKKLFGLSMYQLILISTTLSVPLFAIIIKFHDYQHYIVWILSVGIIFYLYRIFISSTKKEKGKLSVLIYFTFLACLFWSVFEQAGSSLTLFAQRNVDLTFMNASQSNSLNSAYIVLLAIPFSLLWSYLSNLNKNPSSPFKMGLGLIFVGIGFLIFGISGHDYDSSIKVPMIYLLLGIFIYTIGEMMLSPIGLSKVTELAPKKFLSFLMGVWFLSSFYGHFFAGKVAQLTTIVEGEESFFTKGLFDELVPRITGLDYNLIQSEEPLLLQLYSYLSVFTGIGLVTLLVGILAILISPFVKKIMGDVG